MKTDVGGHLSHALDEVVHRRRMARDGLVALVVGIGQHVFGLVGAFLPGHSAQRGVAVWAGLRLGVSSRDAAVGCVQAPLIEGEAACVALPLARNVLFSLQLGQLCERGAGVQYDLVEIPFGIRQGRSPS